MAIRFSYQNCSIAVSTGFPWSVPAGCWEGQTWYCVAICVLLLSLSLSAIHYSFPSACYTHNKHMSFITENIATEDHSPDITKERMHTSSMQNVSNLTTRQGNTQETHNGILLHAHRIGQKLGLAASFLVHRPRRADREPQDD